jgi:hypothetical protein
VVTLVVLFAASAEKLAKRTNKGAKRAIAIKIIWKRA